VKTRKWNFIVTLFNIFVFSRSIRHRRIRSQGKETTEEISESNALSVDNEHLASCFWKQKTPDSADEIRTRFSASLGTLSSKKIVFSDLPELP